jgi:hypothetical protein
MVTGMLKPTSAKDRQVGLRLRGYVNYSAVLVLGGAIDERAVLTILGGGQVRLRGAGIGGSLTSSA